MFMLYLYLKISFMQFSERNNTTRWIIIFLFNNFTDSLEHLYLFQIFKMKNV
jgi:hypothetical protein